MSRPTQYVPIALCLRLSLRQQGLTPPPPLGLPSEHVTLSWTAFYGLHCVSRCQENITYGGSKQHTKNRLAATRLVDDGLHCVSIDARKTSLTGFKIAKKIGSPLRGSWTMVSIALVDARKHHLRGFKIAKKSARRFAARGRWSPLRQQMPGKHHLRGFKIAKKIGSPLRGSWTMVSIALVDARKTSLTGFKIATKKIGSPLRGSWTMVSIALVDTRKTSLMGVQNSKKIGSPLRDRRWVKPPPWKKLDPPL